MSPLDFGVESKVYDPDMTKHLTLITFLLLPVVIAAQHQTMPAGMSHEEHLRQLQKDEALKHRGALAMGFDQDRTVHHFVLRAGGGEIVVTAKDANDAELIAQVRAHFQEIAGSFGAGLFDKPLATHGEMPPGAETLAANKAQVTYRYDPLPAGARVIIETRDKTTLEAVHAFLRYQIVEHKTGDPLAIQR